MAWRGKALTHEPGTCPDPPRWALSGLPEFSSPLGSDGTVLPASGPMIVERKWSRSPRILVLSMPDQHTAPGKASILGCLSTPEQRGNPCKCLVGWRSLLFLSVTPRAKCSQPSPSTSSDRKRPAWVCGSLGRKPSPTPENHSEQMSQLLLQGLGPGSSHRAGWAKLGF